MKSKPWHTGMAPSIHRRKRPFPWLTIIMAISFTLIAIGGVQVYGKALEYQKAVSAR